MWVYDTKVKTLANLGSLTIHPDPWWDYIKPSWNPWFADGKHLTFFSGPSLYVTSPDGKERRKLLQADHCGLAIPSPDGTKVAYATFSLRLRKGRKDLDFWGGSSLWIVSSGAARQGRLRAPRKMKPMIFAGLRESPSFSIVSAKEFSTDTRGFGLSQSKVICATRHQVQPSADRAGEISNEITLAPKGYLNACRLLASWCSGQGIDCSMSDKP